jgi:hypothetical protein
MNTNLLPVDGRPETWTCFKCRCRNRQIIDSFDDSMKPQFTWHVRPDAYPVAKDKVGISEMERAAGFQFKVIDGKPAKFRYICVDCYSKQEETREWSRHIKDDLKRNAHSNELKDSFYVQEFMLND